MWQSHRIWYADLGPATAPAVLIVHGGPGGRSRDEPLAWWPEGTLRLISIDQRGCGRSEPAGALQHNTVADLVDDMERLRLHLGLEAWALVAGSWGAFVALHYAARHPGRVRGLFLRSPFLGSAAELAHYLAPWPAWIAGAPPAEDPVPEPTQVYRMLQVPLQPDTAFTPGAHALALGPWMQAFEHLQSAPGGLRAQTAVGPAAPARWTEADRASWAVHAAYAGRCWTTGADAVAVAAQALAAVEGPRMVVHGSDDAVCPVDTARALAAACPDLQWVEVPGGGHRMASEPMAGALRQAARRWAAQWAA